MSALPSEPWLGSATEALIADAFTHSLLITAKAAAKLLGLDEKTLAAMTEEGLIRAVRRGKLRAYTERDIRTYLLESPGICRTEKPKRQAKPSAKVISFSERRR